MKSRAFQNLLVWQRARALSIEVYRASAGSSFRMDWTLRDQMRRSAISVPSNIAEGNERGSDRDAARFFCIARGSLAELTTQVDIASELGMLEPEQARRWIIESDELARMLAALISRRKHVAP